MKFKIGGNQGDVCSAMVQTVQMGNGDFFGMVGVINLSYIFCFYRGSLSAMPSSCPAASSTSSLAAALPTWSSSSTSSEVSSLSSWDVFA